MLYKPDDTFGILSLYSYGGDDFQRSIGLFDLRRLARNLSKTGASRFMINLNCPGGFLLSPILVPDISPEKISSRDIPLILGRELEKYGIDLYLYYSVSPASSDTGETVITPGLVKKHAEILEEYSRRFSNLVRGWLIDDCCSFSGSACDFDMPGMLCAACKKGNCDAVVSFIRDIKFSPAKNTARGDCVTVKSDNFSYIPKKTVQTHIITTLGTSEDGSWGQIGLRHDSEQLCGYIKRLHRAMCSLTIDCKIYPDGTFEAVQFNELCKLSDMLKNGEN